MMCLLVLAGAWLFWPHGPRNTVAPQSRGVSATATTNAAGISAVAGAKGVVLRLCPLREGAQAPCLADGGHAVAAPGQDLVGVRLVAHIPDDAVCRALVHVVQGHSQLNDTQRRPQVAPRLCEPTRVSLRNLRRRQSQQWQRAWDTL